MKDQLQKSFYYIFRDLFYAGILYAIAYKLDSILLPAWIHWPLWFIWAFCQGAVITGLWVIAHECGHQAFSPYKWLNDTVGTLFHSLLLVPYHPWRISHSTHHKNTNHIEKDEVFRPITKKEYQSSTSLRTLNEALEHSPILMLLYISFMELFGWQIYLLTHATGRNYGRFTNHFLPSSPIFEKKDRNDVISSNISLLFVLAGLVFLGYEYSFLFVFKYYIMPYCWVNFWLITITLLQHTDTYIPHTSGDQWSFLRGALLTVDRDYGIFNYLHHNIGDSHVAHHLFSTMPHYHAKEATKYLRSILGEHYLRDNTPFWIALWNVSNRCRFVEHRDSADVYHWSNAKQLAAKKS